MARLVDTEGSTRSEYRLNVEDGPSEVRLHCRNHEGERDGFPLSSDPRVTNCGFSEQRKVIFVTNQVSELQLFVDGEPLDPPKTESGKIEWEWTPGQYAGEVRAELSEKDETTKEMRGTKWVFRLDVSPDPNKLGEGSRIFRRMLRDILDMDPELLIDYEPARFQLGAVGANDDALVQLMRLLSKRQELDRALAAIQRDPASVVRPRRRFVPLREVRRADLRTLRSALRNPAALPVIVRNRARRGMAAGPEPFFDTPAVERRLDSPVNRATLWMLRALRRRCEELPDQLSKLKEPQKDTRTSLTKRISRWKHTVRDMSLQLRKAERGRPFSEVERPEITAAGLNAVAADPRYGRFWKVAWAALRKRGDQRHPDTMLPLPPTWEIYERWCVAELKNSLTAWLDKSPQEWADNPNKRLSNKHGIDERKWILDLNANDRLALQSQTHFSNKKDNKKGQPQREGWSVSRQRKPDIVLLREQNREVVEFFLFDAKYTAKKNLLKAVGNTAHAYQDSLRWGVHEGGRRPSATLIVAPNTKKVNAAGWLTDPEFVREHRIGVVELRPGVKPPDWLHDFVTGTGPDGANDG